MLGPPLTVTVLVPPAVPLIVTPAPLKPLTGSLKTAVKLIGELLVGSAWPAAWLRSEERRVGKEGRSRWSLEQEVEEMLVVPGATGASREGRTVATLAEPLSGETAPWG